MSAVTQAHHHRHSWSPPAPPVGVGAGRPDGGERSGDGERPRPAPEPFYQIRRVGERPTSRPSDWGAQLNTRLLPADGAARWHPADHRRGTTGLQFPTGGRGGAVLPANSGRQPKPSSARELCRAPGQTVAARTRNIVPIHPVTIPRARFCPLTAKRNQCELSSPRWHNE